MPLLHCLSLGDLLPKILNFCFFQCWNLYLLAVSVSASDAQSPKELVATYLKFFQTQ